MTNTQKFHEVPGMAFDDDTAREPLKPSEFPGLEQISQKIFQIPYVDLTPNLKRCIRSKAAEAAAGDMLTTLKSTEQTIVAMCGEPPTMWLEVSRIHEALISIRAAIAKAEGH